ncbi:hypothetical protein ACFL0M_15030 [Thermodesulfobacteriota bacterium]
MKIKNVDIISGVMPKEDPEWRFALGSKAKAGGFILKPATEKD